MVFLHEMLCMNFKLNEIFLNFYFFSIVAYSLRSHKTRVIVELIWKTNTKSREKLRTFCCSITLIVRPLSPSLFSFWFYGLLEKSNCSVFFFVESLVKIISIFKTSDAYLA